MYDLIIIGGGPAGITAGIYAARQKLNTLLITKDFGGQVAKKAVAIENYPGFEEISGIELIGKFKKHLKGQEVEIREEEVTGVEKTKGHFFISTAKNNKFDAKALIAASGAEPRHLGVPGEEELTGKGVSYCAVCDGPLFSGKTVAVIGGGNSGFETALFLVNLAEKIYILEYGSGVKADKENQEAVKKSGKVEIITEAAVKEIRGDSFVNSIVYQDRQSQKEKTLSLEGVFVEIGYKPSSSFIKNLVDLNENKEIEVDKETYQTKTPGLFAVGDVNVGKFKQIVIACGEGAKAALAAFNYLKKYE
jgi:alkyl hydroperoxide reductase subunit F